MRTIALAALLCVPATLAAALDATPPEARTIKSLGDLGHAIASCVQAPQHTAGSRLSIRLSVKRNGSLSGKPLITFSKLVGSQADRQELIAAATTGIQACAPFPLDPAFGSAIAGRPFTIGIVAGSKSISI